LILVSQKSSIYGPSLRVQGELPRPCSMSLVTRAIPARAGRTLVLQLYHTVIAGHPCACRENPGILLHKDAPVGPSLRVQGELTMSDVTPNAIRAIPARAGRTQLFMRSPDDETGHPCACRENLHKWRWGT